MWLTSERQDDVDAPETRRLSLADQPPHRPTGLAASGAMTCWGVGGDSAGQAFLGEEEPGSRWMAWQRIGRGGRGALTGQAPAACSAGGVLLYGAFEHGARHGPRSAVKRSSP